MRSAMNAAMSAGVAHLGAGGGSQGWAAASHKVTVFPDSNFLWCQAPPWCTVAGSDVSAVSPSRRAGLGELLAMAAVTDGWSACVHSALRAGFEPATYGFGDRCSSN